MAVINNGKIIRSIPEQVSRNSRRIDEIEAQKSLYLYVVVYSDSDGSAFSFQFVANKGSYEFEDDYSALVEALKDNGTTKLSASGYETVLSEYIMLVNVTNNDEIAVETPTGNTRIFIDSDLDGIYCGKTKIL